MSQRFIEILDLATGGRVVTVIEFLSPSNKTPGEGLEKYRQKQQECRAGGVKPGRHRRHPREGRRQLLAHQWVRARRYDSTYQVSVCRAAPTLPVRHVPRPPSRPPARHPNPAAQADPDAVLDLQSVVDSAYAASRYDRTTDYRQPCDPPLSGEEADWADERLKSAGRH